MATHDRVTIESGTKKVFASALDWPGWSRSGKTEADAIATLADYAPRYRTVAERAGTRGVLAAADAFTVVERQAGGGATDFGVPGEPADAERAPLSDAELDRQVRLLEACWATFDETPERVSAELRKGPRGGGRDRDAIVEHVLESERGYVRYLGIKAPPLSLAEPDGLRAHRDEVVAAIREHHAAGRDARSWPVPYLIRRVAWHVMDHAWEMEDKDLSGERG
jgi:hypothetical protein